MKRIIFYMLLVIATLSSCDSIIMKETTVKIESTNIVSTVTLINLKSKYYGSITKEELQSDYINQLNKRLNSGKIHVVQDNPDYILSIIRIDIVETVITEFYDNRHWDLSKVDIKVEAVLTKNNVDIPISLTFVSQSKEELNTNSKKGHKGKNGNYIDIVGFGGLEGSLRDNAKEARKKIKTEIKKNQ